MDNNHSRIAKVFGEFKVPAAGASASYKATSWTRIGRSRDFTTYRTGPDNAPIELGSASITGAEVNLETTSDPETDS